MIITHWSEILPGDILVHHTKDDSWSSRRLKLTWIVVSIQFLEKTQPFYDDRKRRIVFVDLFNLNEIITQIRWMSALQNKYIDRYEVFRGGWLMTKRKERMKKTKKFILSTVQ